MTFWRNRMNNEQLERLATEAGLSVHWVDANARPQTVSPDVLRKVLEALGYPAENGEAIDASLLSLQNASHGKSAPPLLTVDTDSNLDLSEWFAPQTPFTLHLEDGSSLDARLTA
ncbi:4-alpha-glucanotransferase, partial [Pseudomonas amygdali pv. tabaci]